jgi:hypothetical protein
MAQDNAAWLALQRKRWMRANAHLHIRGDAYRFMPHGAPRYYGKDAVRYFWPEHPSVQASQADEPQEILDHSDLSAEIAAEIKAIQYELAKIKFEIRYQRLMRRLKAGYNPDQPRVPAGNPGGGQWTGEEGGTNDVADMSGDPTLSLPGGVMSDADPDPIKPGAQYAQARTTLTTDPNALTGRSTIDDTTKSLGQTLARVMDIVGLAPDLSPQLYGTAVHTAFAAAVRLQNLPGIGFWDVERTFSLDNNDPSYGLAGSIRTDVVLRNDQGDIIAIYDVKTGERGLSQTRVNELRDKTGADLSVRPKTC